MSRSRPVPPEGQVLQMVMGGWISTTIAALSKHHVPDVLEKHGPMTAAEMVDSGGWEIEVAGERIPARASLRALYDPRGERARG